MEVPRRMLGLIIGKGGETIKGMSEETGAVIRVLKDDDPRVERESNLRPIRVEGTRLEVMAAVVAIKSLVEKEEEKIAEK